MNRSGRDSAARPATRALRKPALLGVIAMAASCAPGGGVGPDRPNGRGPAHPHTPTEPRANQLEIATLATYIGEYDGRTGEFTLTAAEVGTDGQVRQAILGTQPSTGTGPSGPTTAPANTILLRQNAARSVDGACNTLASSAGETLPGGFTGVCVSVSAINGFASNEVVRTYVELSTLTNNNGSGPIAALISAPADSDFGISNANGLWSYGRLAIAGAVGPVVAGGASVPIDRTTRNWYFDTPEPGAMSSFRFIANVRAQLVSPIARAASTVAGTSCGALANTRTATSEDGRYVAFTGVSLPVACRAGGSGSQVFRHDMVTGTTELVSYVDGSPSSGCNGANGAPTISRTGQYVAFQSACTNIIPSGDAFGLVDNNGAANNVFVRDMSTGSIYLVDFDETVGTGSGTAAATNPAISADGSYVAFETASVLTAADSGSTIDIYRRDVFGGVMTLVSQSGTSASLNPAISEDGDVVVFQSAGAVAGLAGGGFTDVFRYRVSTDNTIILSNTSTGANSNGNSQNPAISSNGQVVAFESVASNLVGPASSVSHIYTRGVDGAGLTRITDRGLITGADATGPSTRPSLSGNGRFVVYNTAATNFDALDNSSTVSVYMFDRVTTDPRRIRQQLLSVSATNQNANALVGTPFAGDNGNTEAFISAATNLVPSTPAGSWVFVTPMR